jgi:protein-L-isoaspartate(D-aspartate) O-methyltransferase
MYVQSRKKLVSHLKKHGYIKTALVEQAFLKVPREKFVSKSQIYHAYDDTPLQIGKGQTISAPHMVAIMCEALDVHPGQRILEVGAGSGYHAAIIAQIVGSTGQIYSIERIESLADKARSNLKTAEIENVMVAVGDGSKGLSEFAPYDRIYITCAAPSLPTPLVGQIVSGGKILVPEGDMMCTLRLYEERDAELISKNLGGCVFVPLIGEFGH